MKKSRILIVDDDASIRKFVRANLVARNYDVSIAENGIEALNIAKNEKFDLIILDITMPYLDGIEVCRRMREWSKVPIIMLSARDGESDKLRCLELGADDYITKPFSLNELLCRIKVIFRRTQDSGNTKIQSRLNLGDLEIDPDSRTVLFKGKAVKLTATEHKILTYLALNAGRVVSGEQILEKIWGPGYLDKPNLLWVNMCRIRSKFNLLSEGDHYIQTIGGSGYMIAEKNTVLSSPGKTNLKIATKDYQQQLENKIEIQTAEIQRLSLSGIEALIYALEAKDGYTAGHSRRVTDISIALGRAIGLSETDMEDLRWGSLLHDVGKIAVDPQIQNKPDTLTKAEYEIMMAHPRVGVDIVKPVVNHNVVDIIEHHHDHFDGSGLHQNLRGKDIPLGARILAIADAFDA
ncbi:MAG TPA: response regulator, partial [Dehalococcoidales bacterium]